MDNLTKAKEFLLTPKGKSLYDQAMAEHGLPSRAMACIVMYSCGYMAYKELDTIVKELLK